MDTGSYSDASLTIMNLMKATLGDRINSYWLGAPDAPLPESAYPALVIQQAQGDIDVESTGEDGVYSDIMLHILTNTKDDINSSGDTDLSLRKLQNMIQARDPISRQWLAGTVMYAIRTNIDLGATIINNKAQVQYDITPRPDAPAIKEAIITINTYERVPVPNRT